MSNLYSLLRIYILMLSVFFYYLYTTDNIYIFNNKFVFYATTVYVPFFMFATVLLYTKK